MTSPLANKTTKLEPRDPYFKVELTYTVAAIVIFALLLMGRDYVLALSWSLFSLFTFAVWRASRSDLRP